MFGVLLPPSFKHAQHYAEPVNRRRNRQHLVTTRPTSAEKTPDEQDQTLVALPKLARWPRLRNTHLPEPTVGGLEVDPAGLGDQIGVKGLSVYSAFFAMEDLRCRVCGRASDTIDNAILHQRHARHYQA